LLGGPGLLPKSTRHNNRFGEMKYADGRTYRRMDSSTANVGLHLAQSFDAVFLIGNREIL